MEYVSKIKDDGEKWPRKFYFEIPPWGNIVVLATEFMILGKNLPFYEVRRRDFKLDQWCMNNSYTYCVFKLSKLLMFES